MAKKIFDKTKAKRPKMSAFNLSRNQKLSCNIGELVPTYLEEIVPGDQFRVKSEIMMRLAPMLAPVMHNIDVYMHYFFVPNRLVWNQWEEFITGGQDGQTTAQIPKMAYRRCNSRKQSTTRLLRTSNSNRHRKRNHRRKLATHARISTNL